MNEVHRFVNLIFRATIIPGLLTILWLTGLISITLVEICLVLFLLVFIVFPIIFSYSVTLQRGILFLTFITYPKDLDLSNPSSVGLFGTRNFYVSIQDHEESLRIGVWHVLPLHVVKRFATELQIEKKHYKEFDSLTDDDFKDEVEPLLKKEFPAIIDQYEKAFFDRMLKLPGTIVLYLHGNTASRGSGHRVDIYKLLRKLGYHVITLDYRGYGDSDPLSPSEEGVVRDAKAVYDYIRSLSTNPVIIWGHSLGTGVATSLCQELTLQQDTGVRGVVLESPFTNIGEEIRMHPFARLFKYLPWFDRTIAKPMYMNSLRFESDKYIGAFRQPIMILHAEDDYVVPFTLGYKLYRIALDIRGNGWGPVEFHRFDGDLQYGHKFLCKAPELPVLVKNFIENYKNEIF